MASNIRNQTAIAGVGVSRFGRRLPESPLQLAAIAFKAALADAGLTRDEVDGLSINLGWPLGLDYDRIAETFGLHIRYANQSWTHGRFVASALQHAALAVYVGMADVVACITACSFTQQRGLLGGDDDVEGTREDGGSHAESHPYGLTSPMGGAALSWSRYMARYGVAPELLAAVPMALRAHAQANPQAIMRKPMTLDDYMGARFVIEPLRLFDCCLVSDGAACVLVTTAERARDLASPPVYISGMQGFRAGREEFVMGPPGLGINQQSMAVRTPRAQDLEVYRMAGVERADVGAFYTYDAFSPLVVFALERFGFAGQGEAADWVQGGRIGPSGELPVNTSGGLLSEAHVSGWNSIVEITRQLRGDGGERQVPNAKMIQWGAVWGDSIIFANEGGLS